MDPHAAFRPKPLKEQMAGTMFEEHPEPSTSEVARRKAMRSARTDRERILLEIAKSGSTGITRLELTASLGMLRDTVNARVSELLPLTPKQLAKLPKGHSAPSRPCYVDGRRNGEGVLKHVAQRGR